MNITVKHFLEIEAVSALSEFVDVFDLRTMENVALAADSSEWAAVGVHRREKHTRVGYFSLNVLWPVIPVDSDRIDWLRWVVVGVEKLHNPGKIVGFAGRLANEVNMVCKTLHTLEGVWNKRACETFDETKIWKFKNIELVPLTDNVVPSHAINCPFLRYGFSKLSIFESPKSLGMTGAMW